MLPHGEVEQRKERDDGGEASFLEFSGRHVSTLERAGTFNLNGRDIDTSDVAELCEFLRHGNTTSAAQVKHCVTVLQIRHENVEPSEVAAIAGECVAAIRMGDAVVAVSNKMLRIQVAIIDHRSEHRTRRGRWRDSRPNSSPPAIEAKSRQPTPQCCAPSAAPAVAPGQAPNARMRTASRGNTRGSPAIRVGAGKTNYPVRCARERRQLTRWHPRRTKCQG